MDALKALQGEEKRARQISNITEQTIGISTQHSDDSKKGVRDNSPVGWHARPRNFSTNEQSDARSRGLSGELNIASKSTSSFESGRPMQQRFADKVRDASLKGVGTPENREESYELNSFVEEVKEQEEQL